MINPMIDIYGVFVPAFLMMALGALVFMAGFTMIGFVQGLGFFLAALIIATIGEMIFFPTNKALAAGFAPVEMRGRYMVWLVAGIGVGVQALGQIAIGGLDLFFIGGPGDPEDLVIIALGHGRP